MLRALRVSAPSPWSPSNHRTYRLSLGTMTPPKARVKRKYGPRSQYTWAVSVSQRLPDRRGVGTAGKHTEGRLYHGSPKKSSDAQLSLLSSPDEAASGPAPAPISGDVSPFASLSTMVISLAMPLLWRRWFAIAAHGVALLATAGRRACPDSRVAVTGQSKCSGTQGQRVRGTPGTRGTIAVQLVLLRVGKRVHVAARRQLGSHAPPAAVFENEQEIVGAVEGKGRTTALGRVPRTR